MISTQATLAIIWVNINAQSFAGLPELHAHTHTPLQLKMRHTGQSATHAHLWIGSPELVIRLQDDVLEHAPHAVQHWDHRHEVFEPAGSSFEALNAADGISGA